MSARYTFTVDGDDEEEEEEEQVEDTARNAREGKSERDSETGESFDVEPPQGSLKRKKGWDQGTPAPQQQYAQTSLGSSAREARGEPSASEDLSDTDGGVEGTSKRHRLQGEFGPVLNKVHDVVDEYLARNGEKRTTKKPDPALEQFFGHYLRESATRFHEYESKLAQHSYYTRAVKQMLLGHKKLRLIVQAKMRANQDILNEQSLHHERTERARAGIKQVAQLDDLVKALAR